MKISRLDHLVLTVKDVEKSCKFYNEVLGMEIVTFGQDRKAASFGEQKLISGSRQGNRSQSEVSDPGIRRFLPDYNRSACKCS